MDSLRDRIARVISPEAFDALGGQLSAFAGSQAREKADNILALPEIKEALERQVARNLEGRWPDDPRPCEPSQ